MKGLIRLRFAFAVLLGWSAAANADDRMYGKPRKIYAEPDRAVFAVSDAPLPNPCGGEFYMFYRAPPHYSELYALALTAYTTKATLEIVTRGCEGDRALVHHMAIYE